MTLLAIGGVIMRNLPGKQSTEWTVSFFFFLSIYKYFNKSLRKNSLWSLQEKLNELLLLIKSWDICIYHDWKETIVLKSYHHGGFYLQWPKQKN